MSKDNSNGYHNKSITTPEAEEETNKSFVRKVRSRVSGLLPSSLSKWFGSDGTKAVVRSREEDEDEEIHEQPPVKRIKLPNPTTSVMFPPPRAGTSKRLFLHDDVAGPSGIDYTGDKDSESGESSSGYSITTAKPTAPCKDKTDAYDITNVINENQLFNSSNFGHGRSLFTDQSSSHGNTSLSSRRPSFNASTFGSPNFVDRTLTTQRIMNSPFYNGCTMYGGASAHQTQKPQRVQIKPINETVQNANHSATLSKTAQRILNTLEQYTTDVNKIPHPLNDKKILSAKYSGAHPYVIREHRPSNTELRVPTVPDLLKMKLKERLQDSTLAVSHIASTSKTAQAEYKSSKHTNKIKNKVSSVRQKPEEETVVQKTNLPEIPLPITTLPKFDLSFPLPTSNTNVTKPVTVVACSEASKSKPEVIKPLVQTPEKVVINHELLEFKFAEPLVLAENLKSVIAINDFKFSEPVIFNNGFNLKCKIAAPKVVENAMIDLAKFKPSNDTWECSVCMLRNLSDKKKCVACEAIRRTDDKVSPGFGSEFKISEGKWECTSCMVRNLNKDSVCVACSTPKQKLNGPLLQSSTIPTTLSSFGSQFKAPSGTWECTSCMIRNKEELTKCAACETRKPSKIQDTSQSVTPTFGSLFKSPSGTWECTTCMIRNKEELNKCAACETPRSGAATTQTTTTSSFGSKFKAPNATWECTSCMIRNKDELSKCAACETPKPGGSTTQSATTSTFGIKFKPPSGTWECATCMIRNKEEHEKCAACETPRPGSSANTQKSTSISGQWKCGACAMNNTSSRTKCVMCDTAKGSTKLPDGKPSVPAFTFGIFPNKTNAVGFSSNESKDKVDTPSFIFGKKPDPAPAPFTFGVQETKLNVDSVKNDTSQETFTSKSESTNKYFSSSKTAFSVPPKSTAENIFNITSSVVKSPSTTSIISGTTSVVETSPASTKPLFEATVQSKPILGFSTTTTTSTTITSLPAPTFTFASQSKPSGGFSFGQKPIESEKAPIFNFGATPSGGFSFSSTTTSSTAPVFSFSAPKTESSSLFQTAVQTPKNIFGTESVVPPTQPVAPVQNGVFNFGGTPAKAGFTFGASAQPQFNAPPANPAPAMFSFGGSQPTSTTTTTTTTGFNFGSTAFNAEVKPTFNFSGGATPTFSAQPTTDSPVARRKIRAVRRNPQR